MKTKPLFIPFMSLILVLISISFPIQIAIVFNYNLFDFKEVLTKLTPLNYIVMTLLTYTSFLTYKMNPKVFVLLPFLNLLVFINNFVVSEYGQLYSHTQTFLVSAIFLFITLTFYRKDIYKVYHDLKFRYWLTTPRFKKNLPVEIHINGKIIKSETFDISLSGLFIKADISMQLFDVKTHQDVKLVIIDKNKKIKLSAYIMRKCIAQGHYPAGIGVKINHNEETIFWNKEVNKLSRAA